MARYLGRKALDDARALGALDPDEADRIAVEEDPARVVRDSEDDYLVALARAASVDALVSVDKDLLD